MSFHSFTSTTLGLFFSCLLLSATSSSTTYDEFIQCVSKYSDGSIASVVYSPSNSSYASILVFSIQYLNFITPTAPKPEFIITPLSEAHIQATVICSKNGGFLIRVRSGGHDYAGQSYISPKPFVIIDLVKFQSINVDIVKKTAWIQAGATIGEVYYTIAQKTNTLGFPAGVCPTVCVGGHISGGGLGFLWRKYGMAADNVLDAYLVDVNGKLHDRNSMGEDLFWAIRGGGGNSFGVIVAWKVQLVPVPPIVTVFNVPKTLEQGATGIFYKWQHIAYQLPKDLQIRTSISPVKGKKPQTLQVVFQSVFQGRVNDLIPLMETYFPELGLEAKDCTEMSWINSTLFVYGLIGPLELLLNRSKPSKNFLKAKSDFVQEPIAVEKLEGLWHQMLQEEKSPTVIGELMGGRMGEISESATPFPYRKGYLYNIQYYMTWQNRSASAKYLETTRRIYNYMTPYVSKSPRASYLNYKDTDLGTNVNSNTSYTEAHAWGEKYFNGNFARLASVKMKADPQNYLWDQQSIPPYSNK